MKTRSDYINDFLIISSASVGLIAGGGSLFIGFTRARFIIVVLSFIAVIVGAFAASTLIKREEDEYEKIISSTN